MIKIRDCWKVNRMIVKILETILSRVKRYNFPLYSSSNAGSKKRHNRSRKSRIS